LLLLPLYITSKPAPLRNTVMASTAGAERRMLTVPESTPWLRLGRLGRAMVAKTKSDQTGDNADKGKPIPVHIWTWVSLQGRVTTVPVGHAGQTTHTSKTNSFTSTGTTDRRRLCRCRRHTAQLVTCHEGTSLSMASTPSRQCHRSRR